MIDYPDFQDLWQSEDDRENDYGFGEMISTESFDIYLLWHALPLAIFLIPNNGFSECVEEQKRMEIRMSISNVNQSMYF